MDTNALTFSEEKMEERGERVILTLKRGAENATLSYLVSVSDGEPPNYSIYVEYTDAERHTVGEIPRFSSEKETAERFCAMLARFGVTPLSLDAVYEDTLTP